MVEFKNVSYVLRNNHHTDMYMTANSDLNAGMSRSLAIYILADIGTLVQNIHSYSPIFKCYRLGEFAFKF